MEHRAKWGGDENNVVFPSVGQKTSTAHELHSCSSTTRPLVGGVLCMMQQQTLLEGNYWDTSCRSISVVTIDRFLIDSDCSDTEINLTMRTALIM